MSFLAPCCAPSPVRPNIILIIADDQDISKLGFVGDGVSVTPTLDRLAAAGVVFPTAYVTPRCRPTLAGLLSGLPPTRNGIYTNAHDKPLRHNALLPQLLSAAGYATYAEGKFWEGDPRSAGFAHGPLPGPKDRFLNENRFVRETQEQVLQFLEDRGDQPFFIWYAPLLPHAPLNPPADLLEVACRIPIFVPNSIPPDEREDFKRDEAIATAMNAWLDRGVQELMAKVEELELERSTLFIFLSDNGMANGHVSKGSPFDKALMTPLVFQWNGQLKPRRIEDTLASYLDVMPTILDYAGVPIPEACTGRSLRPWLAGQPEPSAREILHGASYAWAETQAPPHENAYAIFARTREWKYIRWLKDVSKKDNDATFHITHDYAPFPQRTQGSEGLYYVAKDPMERHNLASAGEHARVLKRLREVTRRWWKRQVRTSGPQ